MIRIKLLSGKIVECDGYLEVVETVKNESPFTEGQSIEEYLKGVSERYGKVHDIDVLSLGSMKQVVKFMEDACIIEIMNKG